MAITDITVVSYLTEKHKDWLEHWCDQLNAQTIRGFKVILIFHNWSCTSALHGPSTGVRQNLDDDILVEFYDHCGPKNIGDVIDFGRSKVDTIYLAHWDVDDIFHPQRLELQAKFLADHPDIDFLNARCLGFIGEPQPEMFDLDFIGPDEPYVNVTDHEDIKRCLLNENKNCLSHGLMIYKADVMRKLGGFSNLNVMDDPLGRSPDMETWKKALMAGAKFHRLPQLLMLWNLTSSAIRDTSNAKE